MKNLLQQKEKQSEEQIIKYPELKVIYDKQIKHQFDVYGTDLGKEAYEMEYFYGELENCVENKIKSLLLSQKIELLEKVCEIAEKQKQVYIKDERICYDYKKALDDIISTLQDIKNIKQK